MFQLKFSRFSCLNHLNPHWTKIKYLSPGWQFVITNEDLLSNWTIIANLKCITLPEFSVNKKDGGVLGKEEGMVPVNSF